MKRLVICFLMAGFVLMLVADVLAVGGEINADANAVGDADANAVGDANANAVGEEGKAGAVDEAKERRERDFKRLEVEGKKHVQMWSGSKKVDKLDLYKAGQKQISDELKFIRQLAIDEGAVETVAAIERLLESRKQRFVKTSEVLEKARERAMEKDKDDAKDRGRERKAKDDDQVEERLTPYERKMKRQEEQEKLREERQKEREEKMKERQEKIKERREKKGTKEDDDYFDY